MCLIAILINLYHICVLISHDFVHCKYWYPLFKIQHIISFIYFFRCRLLQRSPTSRGKYQGHDFCVLSSSYSQVSNIRIEFSTKYLFIVTKSLQFSLRVVDIRLLIGSASNM